MGNRSKQNNGPTKKLIPATLTMKAAVCPFCMVIIQQSIYPDAAAWAKDVKKHSTECPKHPLVILTKELQLQIDKYEQRKCNAGHEDNLPVYLWDCPTCTKLVRDERDEFKERLDDSRENVASWRREYYELQDQRDKLKLQVVVLSKSHLQIGDGPEGGIKEPLKICGLTCDEVMELIEAHLAKGGRS